MRCIRCKKQMKLIEVTREEWSLGEYEEEKWLCRCGYGIVLSPFGDYEL